MSESLSLAARLAANLFVDAIKLAKPGARLAAKVGDRLLGGSPFNEREAQRFLTTGGSELDRAEEANEVLDPHWADGGPTEWLPPAITCPRCHVVLMQRNAPDDTLTCPKCEARCIPIRAYPAGAGLTAAAEMFPQHTKTPDSQGEQPVGVGVTGPGAGEVADSPVRPISEMLTAAANWIANSIVDEPRRDESSARPLVAELRTRAAQFADIEK